MGIQRESASFVGGRELRKIDQQSRVQKIRVTVDDLIERASPGWLQVPPVVLDFPQELKAIEDSLKEKFASTNKWKTAKTYLGEFVESLSNGHRLGLPVPTAPIRKARKTLLRGLRWSKQRRLMNEAHEDWKSKLGREVLFKLDDRESLGAILYLAATYGGLCEPRAICALALKIQEEQPLFYSEALDCLWLELVYDPRGLANTRIDGKAMCLRRWLVPPICRLSLLRYLRVPRAPQETGEQYCHESIAAYYRAITGKPFPFGKLGPFLKVSFCVGERQPAVRFEEFLGEYVISRQESASASFESFVGLMGSSRER